MQDQPERPDAVLVAGPTASGKSAFAMELAQRLDGTIVNADSMQVHSGLRIITARPSEADERLVPHRLYGHVPVRGEMSVAAYATQVQQVFDEVRESGRLPIFVGGTGLYFQALEDGLSSIPVIAPDVREKVRRLDSAALVRALRIEDPDAAAALRASDTQRLARALEVVRSTGRPLASYHAERRPGPLSAQTLRRIRIMPDRGWLHARIAARARSIVDDPEAIAEAISLSMQDPESSSLAAKAIGYQEVLALAEGRMTRDEAIERLTVATRRYAKRQYTWFNNSLRGEWATVRPPEDAVVA